MRVRVFVRARRYSTQGDGGTCREGSGLSAKTERKKRSAKRLQEIIHKNVDSTQI